jgi:hypothetical protein
MFTNLESTSPSNIVEVTPELKEHVLAHIDTSVAAIRHKHPFNGSYLSASQIKAIRDEANSIANKMDGLMQGSITTKTALVLEVNKEVEDTVFAAKVVDARIVAATGAGTFASYLGAVKVPVDVIEEPIEITK